MAQDENFSNRLMTLLMHILVGGVMVDGVMVDLEEINHEIISSNCSVPEIEVLIST
jgi:hypothetical protein